LFSLKLFFKGEVFMKNVKFLILVLALGAATACTKSDDSSKGEAPTASSPTSAAATSVAAEKDITIASVGEQMQFDKTELTVKAGEEITLKFLNNSTTLAHNWVLVKPGKEDDVGNAGVQAGAEKNYVPKSTDVLAYTRLLPPKGQKYADKPSEVSTGVITITFKAPPAGDYPYICTNAGHHTVMKGVLHSK
jgi:azurin